LLEAIRLHYRARNQQESFHTYFVVEAKSK